MLPEAPSAQASFRAANSSLRSLMAALSSWSIHGWQRPGITLVLPTTCSAAALMCRMMFVASSVMA